RWTKCSRRRYANSAHRNHEAGERHQFLPLERKTAVDTGHSGRTRKLYHFDRHTPEYRGRFAEITREMHEKCPVAWTETHGGHWVAAGHREVFELARCPHVSNDRDY